MSGIRIKKNNIYRIEVNDNKEYIEFDLSDVNLNFKLYEAIENINKIQTETIDKQKELLQKIIEEDNDEIYTENKKELAKLEKDTFIKIRKAMDGFLGEGACQKIFGDWNGYDMFDLLIEELSKPRKELNGKSHLDMLKLKSDDMKTKLVNKYKKNKKAVI